MLCIQTVYSQFSKKNGMNIVGGLQLLKKSFIMLNYSVQKLLFLISVKD